MMSNNISQSSTTESGISPFIEGSRFSRNVLAMFLFSLPVMYLGIILAVFVHEVIGHGLTALLLGGQFSGFGIALDGMGWADVRFGDLPALSKAIIILAGAFYPTVFSILFFALSRALRKRYLVAFAFLFFAITSLLDSLPYFFWDAIFLAGIGDFSLIWTLYPSQALRTLTIALCGLLMVSAIVTFNIRYYKIAYYWLGEGKPIKLKGKITSSVIIFLLQAMGWFSFDWNQLIPGIGSLPSIVALAIVLATLIPLVVFYEVERSAESQQETFHAMLLPICVAWMLCIGVILTILQWLQKGVALS